MSEQDLRQQAEHCRNLAILVSDPDDAEELRVLANNFDAEAEAEAKAVAGASKRAG